ncbi:ATPase [Horticoccus luteus]|uniref:ATPase n=1 Tax=Horticoccus luteus TaxID=2862869 RepID=A0A8F9TW18_9BACT|nr:BadF/BadG/BcrA/BcrD ATPase family protein [Horticoccus luteus]QYM79122.1 ATPase [Horticoccus luteus]
MSCKIGLDGGGTKTEGILVNVHGDILARHLAPGCNPSVAGADQARLVVTDTLCALAAAVPAGETISATLLCLAGNRAFWREFAATLSGFGAVQTADDSLPVLELATHGQPGLVLHAGTGSFVAARDAAGALHYAGGLGWRFGDPGCGYDLGRRAIARALLELQGWGPPSRLATTLCDYTGLADAGALTRFFYHDPQASQKIAGLAPALLRLASEGDATAHQLVVASVLELAELATRVATKLFPDTALDVLPAGLSGPILIHPVVHSALAARTPLALAPVSGSPIDGVRELLARLRP